MSSFPTRGGGGREVCHRLEGAGGTRHLSFLVSGGIWMGGRSCTGVLGVCLGWKIWKLCVFCIRRKSRCKVRGMYTIGAKTGFCGGKSDVTARLELTMG